MYVFSSLHYCIIFYTRMMKYWLNLVLFSLPHWSFTDDALELTIGNWEFWDSMVLQKCFQFKAWQEPYQGSSLNQATDDWSAEAWLFHAGWWHVAQGPAIHQSCSSELVTNTVAQNLCFPLELPFLILSFSLSQLGRSRCTGKAAGSLWK